MGMLHIVLLVAAFICFLIAATGVPTRINLIALGLMCWILTVLLGAGGGR